MRLLFVAHTLPLPGQSLSNVGGMQRVSVEQLAALRRLPDTEVSALVLESSSRWTGVRTVPFLLRLLRGENVVNGRGASGERFARFAHDVVRAREPLHSRFDFVHGRARRNDGDYRLVGDVADDADDLALGKLDLLHRNLSRGFGSFTMRRAPAAPRGRGLPAHCN